MDSTITSLFTSLATVIRNVTVPIGVVAFMVGALMYATANGNLHQLETARTAMKSSIIGVVAVFLASIVVNTIVGAVGGPAR